MEAVEMAVEVVRNSPAEAAMTVCAALGIMAIALILRCKLLLKRIRRVDDILSRVHAGMSQYVDGVIEDERYLCGVVLLIRSLRGELAGGRSIISKLAPKDASDYLFMDVVQRASDDGNIELARIAQTFRPGYFCAPESEDGTIFSLGPHNGPGEAECADTQASNA